MLYYFKKGDFNMDCNNDLCIYWKADTCTLDSISINEIGLCNEYISVDIPSDAMEEYRKKHLLRRYEYESGLYK